MDKRSRKIFRALFLLFVILSLLTLHLLPLPWIDSVGYLDPARNFIEYGRFASDLWPHQGTDRIFLAHLPALQWVNMLSFLLFPDHWVWTTRLIPLLLFYGGVFFMLRQMRFEQFQAWVLALVLAFFMMDKAVFEMMRSMRMENIEFFFLAGILYWTRKGIQREWTALFCGLLVVTHPKSWMLALIGFVFLLWSEKDNYKRLLWMLLAAFPAFLYLLSARFDLHEIYQQLIVHGRDHTIDTVPGNRFFKHFIGRFLYFDQGTRSFSWYYENQFYVPLLNVLAIFISVRNLLRQFDFRKNLPEIMFLGNQLYWFAVLGPFHKYNMVLLVLMYFILGRQLNRLDIWQSIPFKRGVFLILVILFFAFPVYSRFGGALLQWNERSPAKFNAWLHEQIQPSAQERILIIEPCTAWYYSLDHENVDFQMKFWLFNNQFTDYDRVYYLHQQPIKGYTPLASYEPDPMIPSFRLQSGGMTHYGLKLYEVDEALFDDLIEWERRK